MNRQHLAQGLTLAARASTVRVVVLTGGSGNHALTCDGDLLHPSRPLPCSSRQVRPFAAGLIAGAVYRDEQSGVELRCVEADGRVLAVDGRPMRRVVGHACPTAPEHRHRSR